MPDDIKVYTLRRDGLWQELEGLRASMRFLEAVAVQWTVYFDDDQTYVDEFISLKDAKGNLFEIIDEIQFYRFTSDFGPEFFQDLSDMAFREDSPYRDTMTGQYELRLTEGQWELARINDVYVPERNRVSEIVLEKSYILKEGSDGEVIGEGPYSHGISEEAVWLANAAELIENASSALTRISPTSYIDFAEDLFKYGRWIYLTNLMRTWYGELGYAFEFEVAKQYDDEDTYVEGIEALRAFDKDNNLLPHVEGVDEIIWQRLQELDLHTLPEVGMTNRTRFEITDEPKSRFNLLEIYVAKTL